MHNPLTGTFEKVAATDLEYDLQNRRVLWMNDFRPFEDRGAFERAMLKYGNVKRLEDDIRAHGVLMPLITAPYEAKNGRIRYRTYGGNTRLFVVNRLNNVARMRGLAVPFPSLPCLVYDMATMQRHKDRILYADHQIPAKRWPAIQRVLSAGHLHEEGLSADKIQEAMMLPSKAEVAKLIRASQLFRHYLDAVNRKVSEVDPSKVSFFIEAASRKIFNEFRNFEVEFANWVAQGLFVAANADVRNLARIAEIKAGGYEFARTHLNQGKTLRQVIGEMKFDEVMRLGLTPTLNPKYAA